MDLIFKAIFSAMSSIGFAMLFDGPSKSYKIVAVSSFLGWIFYSLILNFTGNKYAGVLLASLLTGVIGQVASRKIHMPVTVFVIPGIIPYVPGANLYYCMYYLVGQEYDMATTEAQIAMLTAGSIAIGISISSIMSKSIIRNRLEVISNDNFDDSVIPYGSAKSDNKFMDRLSGKLKSKEKTK
ncbi:MAG: threonine/serine exporter family protein [Finegoldia sp.]|nr:threonine/serine exporter family protein [Finegoldia sp.]